MEHKSIDFLIEIPGKSPLVIAAPSTLEELLTLISQYSSLQEINFSLLCKQNDNWLKITTQENYLSLLEHSQSEISVKLEFNNLPSSTESKGENTSKNNAAPLPEPSNKAEETLIIQYRYLNSSNPEELCNLRIPALDITLGDLSNLVLNSQNKSPEDWIFAFYSEDGCPLSGSLSQMPFIKCNEIITESSKLSILIVPNFDVKSLPGKDPNEGIDTIILQSSADPTKSFTIKVDLSTTTIQDLKQKLFSLTKSPTFEIKFKTNDIFLTNDAFTLSSYAINSDQVVYYWREKYDYTDRAYKSILKRTIEQSSNGIKLFHSFLYCFTNIIGTSEIPTKEAFLGILRQASQNNTPLLHALYELSLGKPMSLLDSIAIEEGFIFILNFIIKDLNLSEIPEDKLYENCLEIIGLLCDLACKPSEEFSRDENYVEYDTVCPISLVEIKNPVLLKKLDGSDAYYEQNAVMKRVLRRAEIPGVGIINKSQVKVNKDFAYSVKRAIYNGKTSVILWTGTFDNKTPFPSTLRSSFPQLPTFKRLQASKTKYKLSRIIPALFLKSTEFLHCITLDKNKEIVVNRGLSPKEPNTVKLMNILTREVAKHDIDDMASSIERISKNDPAVEKITRPPDETIVVLFDKSGSMVYPFGPEGEYSRLDATKQFFESFADRTVGYNLNHVVSLILFNNKLDKACSFTENISTFTAVAHQSKHAGGTKLWDAIFEAIKALVEFKGQYPETQLRILCLSDGEDTSSAHDHLEVSKLLISNNIVMDSVVVGDLSENLKAISYASGGYVFLPNDLQEGIKLFESETLLSVRNRKSIEKIAVNTDHDLEALRKKEFSDQQPAMAAPVEISKSVISAEEALKVASASQPVLEGKGSASCIKRIMKELENISTNPHENIIVLPTESDIMFWNLYIEGPTQTPFEGGLFQAYIRFPQDYPFKPPTMRFVTPIYHCNINSTGRICHSILDQFYSPAVSIRQIMDCVYGLLMTPEPMDPLDAYIAAEFNDNYELYLVKCREHVVMHASKSFEELTGMPKPVRAENKPDVAHGESQESEEFKSP